MTKNVHTPDDVRKIILPIIDARQPNGYRIVLKEIGDRPWMQTGNAWIAYVDVDRDEVSATDLADHLAELEQIIQDQTGLDVTLFLSFVHETPTKHDKR